MNYTLKQNKEWLIKLLTLRIKDIASEILAVNRDDYSNEDVKKKIKKYENEKTNT